VKHRILSAWAVAVVLAAAGTARADEPMPPFPQSAPAAPVVVSPLATPADLLAAADAAVDAGNLEEAGRLYEQLAREHPSSPEANAARRALKIIAARNRTAPPAAGDVPPRSDGGDGVVIRRETYSTRTSERLRLSTWEKVDFGSSAFLYGMSVGFSYALSSGDVEDNLLPAMTIGARGRRDRRAATVALGAVALGAVAAADRRGRRPDQGRTRHLGRPVLAARSPNAPRVRMKRSGRRAAGVAAGGRFPHLEPECQRRAAEVGVARANIERVAPWQ
jgi:hypothetical protein